MRRLIYFLARFTAVIGGLVLMALVLMNDPTFVEAARGLAVRTMLRDAVDDVARVEWLFVAVTARRPGPQELETMVRLIADQRTRFRGRPQAARELLSVGQSPLDKRVDVVEQAAWTAWTGGKKINEISSNSIEMLSNINKNQ